ncbi:MAG: AbrB/MazE/SpoVT family DNA-binding domain-containing protein [Treponema sp.]|nr:AbrB/MazE/SpoVT family DNA-binding domain-containing protein [Treponema sp.]
MLVPVVPIGNSRGIRLPKVVLNKFLVKDKMDMEITDKGILLTPIPEHPRMGWAEAFCSMHDNKEDMLENIPDSEDLEWEW